MTILFFLFSLLESCIPVESRVTLKTLKTEMEAWWDRQKEHPLGAKVHTFFEHPLTRFGLLLVYAPVQRAYWKYSRNISDFDDYDYYDDEE